MKKNQIRLNNLKTNQEALNRYRLAIKELEDLHIFDILRELHSDYILSTGSDEFGESIDLMNYHKISGYMQCLDEIHYLVDNDKLGESITNPDFGAKEQLLKDGYSEKEVELMLGE